MEKVIPAFSDALAVNEPLFVTGNKICTKDEILTKNYKLLYRTVPYMFDTMQKYKARNIFSKTSFLLLEPKPDNCISIGFYAIYNGDWLNLPSFLVQTDNRNQMVRVVRYTKDSYLGQYGIDFTFSNIKHEDFTNWTEAHLNDVLTMFLEHFIVHLFAFDAEVVPLRYKF